MPTAGNTLSICLDEFRKRAMECYNAELIEKVINLPQKQFASIEGNISRTKHGSDRVCSESEHKLSLIRIHACYQRDRMFSSKTRLSLRTDRSNAIAR